MLRLWNIAKYQISNTVGFDTVSTTEYYKENYAQNKKRQDIFNYCLADFIIILS